MNNHTIGFIGAGNMAQAIIKGMLNNDFSANDILISDTNSETLAKATVEFGVIAANINDIVQQCDIIILAVKPDVVSSICESIKPQLKSTTIIISIAAGIKIDTIKNILATNNIVRVMPNTPATIGLGASGIFSLTTNSDIVKQIFTSIGEIVWLNREEQIDAITALSGSGPAYFYLMFEAMIEAGIAMGLSANDAKKLCLQTAIGAGKMAKQGDIKQLRAQVTSLNGTTQAAISSLTSDKFNEIIAKAMFQAKNRAQAIANEN